MRARLDPHARYRELLAARLDRPLTRGENRLLVGHLKSCSACQQVDRDYREQRALLRSLPTPLPPRDMWARTSTALDHEMSRWAYRPRFRRRALVRAGRSAGAPSALATVVAALGVITAVVALQLVPTLRQIPVTSSSAPATVVALQPTPFAVPAEPLTLVAADASDLSLFETQVDQVCPQTAPDCFEDSKFVERRFSIPDNVRPENATLSASGRVAFVGHKSEGDVIAVVLLSTDPTPGNRPSVRPTRSTPPTATSTPTHETARPTPTQTEETEPPATASAEPTPDDQGWPSPDTTPSNQPVDSASPTAPAETPTDAADPTPTADASPTREPVASETPETTETPGFATPEPPETPAPETPTPPASAVPGLTVLSILEDVHSAGAPPAWSRDGEVLAFSAMPADGRHGPDVYIWRLGDTTATPITNDHGSFFASWSGRRIVVSRLGTTVTQRDEPQLQTVVVDLETLEERTVIGPEMWLPVVNPQRSHAIGWHGVLDLTGPLPVAHEGALYILDWRELNPFRADEDVAPPDGAPQVELVPFDPTRDPASDPVLDWNARWSADGQVLGVWETDAPTESWGNLVLVTFDPQTGQFDIEHPLLGPAFAKRGFTLGTDRVAWVGPSNESTQGELRIRTWGTGGPGDLRIEVLKLKELVPSF